MPFACDLAILSHAPISDAECLPWLGNCVFSVFILKNSDHILKKQILIIRKEKLCMIKFFVVAVLKNGSKIPVAMARDEEDARRAIQMADEMFELKDVVDYEIEIEDLANVATFHN